MIFRLPVSRSCCITPTPITLDQIVGVPFVDLDITVQGPLLTVAGLGTAPNPQVASLSAVDLDITVQAPLITLSPIGLPQTVVLQVVADLNITVDTPILFLAGNNQTIFMSPADLDITVLAPTLSLSATDQTVGLGVCNLMIGVDSPIMVLAGLDQSVFLDPVDLDITVDAPTVTTAGAKTVVIDGVAELNITVDAPSVTKQGNQLVSMALAVANMIIDVQAPVMEFGQNVDMALSVANLRITVGTATLTRGPQTVLMNLSVANIRITVDAPTVEKSTGNQNIPVNDPAELLITVGAPSVSKSGGACGDFQSGTTPFAVDVDFTGVVAYSNRGCNETSFPVSSGTPAIEWMFNDRQFRMVQDVTNPCRFIHNFSGRNHICPELWYMEYVVFQFGTTLIWLQELRIYDTSGDIEALWRSASTSGRPDGFDLISPTLQSQLSGQDNGDWSQSNVDVRGL